MLRLLCGIIPYFFTKRGIKYGQKCIAGEPQRHEIGNRVFIVEPCYDKNGESMSDILLKLMMADVDEKFGTKATAKKSNLKLNPSCQARYLF